MSIKGNFMTNKGNKIKKYLIIFILFLIVGSCKKINLEDKKTENKIESNKENTTSNNKKTKKPVSKKRFKYYFVSAKSGLNYRKSPKGEVIGKFPLNKQLKVIEYTKIFDQIIDGNKTLKGKWLGVQSNKDTVYVFNSFLSSSFTLSELKIYYASPYYKTENQTMQGFIDLSDSYQWNNKTDSLTIIPKEYLGKDTIKFNQKQKNSFLNKMDFSKNDKVFIYNTLNDSIYTFEVMNLSIIASINIYSKGDKNISEYDYELGFDLGKRYNEEGDSFVYIGKENPFQTGKVKPIIWKTMDSKDFPVKFDIAIVNEDIRLWFEEIVTDESYKFSNNNFDYYIQNLKKNGEIRHRYLVVINSDTEKIVFNDVFIGSESSYIAPLSFENEKTGNLAQWTGEIFKNKPSILYGFLSNSFGCPSIKFLGETEPPIRILCDNRH